MSHLSRIVLIGILGSLVLLESPWQAARAAEPPPEVSKVDFACTDQEAWIMGKNVPAKWVETSFVPAIKSSPVQTLLLTETLRTTAPGTEAKAAAEFKAARALLDLKLTHLAFQSFAALVVRTTAPETQNIRLAALECMNRIEKNHASMILPSELLPALQTLKPSMLPIEKRDAVWLTALNSARHKLASSPNEVSVAPELALLADSGPYLSVVQMLQASKRGSDAEIIPAATAFFRAPRLPEGLKSHEDAVRLMLARAYYGTGSYDQADRIFKRVKNNSNLITDSLVGMAWSNLLKSKYGGAIGAASNLLVGGLRQTFAPEAHVIVSISLHETCHYPEAIESIKYFRKSYEKAYRWLYTWSLKPVAQRPDLYAEVANYLKKRSKLSDRIATEWIRSPVFLADQDELNLILDERQAMNRLNTQIISLKDKVDRTPAKRYIRSLIASSIRELATRESTLMSEINMDLNDRTKRMVSNLATVSQNIQLVEAEVYNSLSERMIADQGPQAKRGLASDSAKKAPKRDDGPTWDWGKFSMTASEDDEAEFWEDELGFLKANVIDQCTS